MHDLWVAVPVNITTRQCMVKVSAGTTPQQTNPVKRLNLLFPHIEVRASSTHVKMHDLRVAEPGKITTRQSIVKKS